MDIVVVYINVLGVVVNRFLARSWAWLSMKRGVGWVMSCLR